MEYKLSKLKNGLKVLTVEKPDLKSATVTVWIGVGSRFENNAKSGISHFLEHMAFKGSKKRPFIQEITETLDSMGADYNAGTSREWTNFYIKSRTSSIKEAFDILSDMIIEPILRPEDIERERGVILEEIAMKEDSPFTKIGDNFMQLIFKGNPLAYDISGTPETIKTITKADFDRFRVSHYHAKNMLITVSGGVKHGEIKKLAERFFNKLHKGERQKPKKFKNDQKRQRLHIENKKSEQAHFVLGFPGYSWNSEKRFAESVLSAILGRGMSSRLFMEIREKRGLAYAVSTSIEKYHDIGTFITYAGVDPKFADEAIEIVLEQLYGISEKFYPIKERELNKAKEYLKGRTALALENTQSINNFYGQRAIYLKKILTPDEVFEKVDKVTIDDVYETAKELFVKEKLNVAIIGPFNKKNKFEKLIK